MTLPKQPPLVSSGEVRREVDSLLDGLPSVIEAFLDGYNGPVDLSPEEQRKALEHLLFLFARYVPLIAAQQDLLYAAVVELQESRGREDPNTH